MLRQSPSGTVREADALARDVAGIVPGDDSGRPPTTARILARGALTARAMGEGAVADLFEDGLRLYGRRASLARAIGRPEDLVAPRATEREVRAERAREAAERAASRGPDTRQATPPTRPVRRSRGLGVTQMLDELDMSDERLAEEAFGIFLPKRRRAAPARPHRHRPRVERCREELRLGGDWAGRAEAVSVAREEMAAEAAARAEEEKAAREALAERPTEEIAAQEMASAETAAREESAAAEPAVSEAEAGDGQDAAREGTPKDVERGAEGEAAPAEKLAAEDVAAAAREREEAAQDRPRKDPDLALRLAVAVAARTPMASPVHGQDLQKGIEALLARPGTRLGDADRNAGPPAVEVRQDSERALAGAILQAVSAGPLPEAGVLRSARSDLLAELTSATVPPRPQPDLGERMAKSFTQGEILALHDARRPMPDSLPPLGAEARDDVALHLQAYAPLDDPAKRPEADPLPVMASMLARPEGRDAFAQLAGSFSFDQMAALRDPGAPVPEGLARLGTEGRARLAQAFRAGPVPERQDTAPDPRLADDVLVLSCAVSERVDASAPVHRSTLPRDVETVLRDSMLARDVPEAEVEEIAFGIARKRAETDLRVATTRKLDSNEYYAAKARFEGNPQFYMKQRIDAYKAAIAKGMRRLHREEPVPTEIELGVARAVVATHGTERHGLAQAMAEALERGTTAGADDIRKERQAVLGALREGAAPRDEIKEDALLRRVYGNFTASEVREICEGRGPHLARIPDDAARVRVRDGMLHLHREIGSPEPSPWRARHAAVARSFGARHEGPEHGRYRGISAEM